jgi:predicted nuclease with TOPRIM domain
VTLKEALDEIERLRSSCRSSETTRYAAEAAGDLQRGEILQLKADLEDAHELRRIAEGNVDALRAEVERLRSENARLGIEIDGLSDDVDDARAECEAMEAVTTAAVACSIGAGNPDYGIPSERMRVAVDALRSTHPKKGG